MANGIGRYTPLLLPPVRRPALIAAAQHAQHTNLSGWAVLAVLAALGLWRFARWLRTGTRAGSRRAGNQR